MYLTSSQFKSATKSQQKIFWKYVFGLLSEEEAVSLLQKIERNRGVNKPESFTAEEEREGETTIMFVGTIIRLALYRTLINQDDTLQNRDKNQFFFLGKAELRNHMVTLCSVVDHYNIIPKPKKRAVLTNKYKFHIIQFWQRADGLFIQSLQTHYTVVCLHVFQFLQDFLGRRAFDHPLHAYLPETQWESMLLRDKACRPRIDAGIGKENIFLLLKVFKKLKRQTQLHEQENPGFVVTSLRGCPFPKFFWNCEKDYPFDFLFDSVNLKQEPPFFLTKHFDVEYFGNLHPMRVL